MKLPAALVMVAILTFPISAPAQQARPVPWQAKIYIEEMKADLDGYIRAEMVKKKVPLRIMMTPDQAHIVMTGSTTEERNRKWHEGWLSTDHDRIQANVSIVDRKTGAFIWAAQAGDRSIWWGRLAPGGRRKVAARLIRELKKAIGKPCHAGKERMPCIDFTPPTPPAPHSSPP